MLKEIKRLNLPMEGTVYGGSFQCFQLTNLFEKNPSQEIVATKMGANKIHFTDIFTSGTRPRSLGHCAKGGPTLIGFDPIRSLKSHYGS